MKFNKNVRKDDLSGLDTSKRAYKMYKRKKNWVVAPILAAMLIQAGAPASLAFAEEVEAPAEETVATQEEAQPAEVAPTAGTYATESVAEVKDNAINKIIPLLTLSDAQKEKYGEAIKVAVNVAAVEAQLKFAYAEAFTTNLENVKKGYKDQIDAFKNLSDARKAAIKGNIDTAFVGVAYPNPATDSDVSYYQAETLKLDKAIAEKKPDAQKIVDAANEENIKEGINAGSVQQAKDTAKTEIDKLSGLSDNDKKLWKEKVDKETTQAGVNTVLANARQASVDAIGQLLTDAKKALKDEIAAADTAGKLAVGVKTTLDNKVNNAGTHEKLEEIRAELAREIDNQASNNLNLAQNALIAYTRSATDKDGKPTFTTSEISSYESRIKATKNLDDLKKLEAEIKSVVVGKKELADAQTEAKGIINNGAIIGNLLLTEKQDYLGRIDDAKDTQTVASILAEAYSKDAANKTRVTNDLKATKDKALEEVSGLKYLTAAERDSFKQNYIDAAAYKEPTVTILNLNGKLAAINNEVDRLKAVNRQNEFNAKLAEARAAITALKNLNVAQSTGRNNDINAIETAYLGSTKTQEELTKAITDLQRVVLQAQDEDAANLVTSLPLDEAKKEAKDKVNSLTGLSTAEKATAVKEIEKATSTVLLKTALDNALELNRLYILAIP